MTKRIVPTVAVAITALAVALLQPRTTHASAPPENTVSTASPVVLHIDSQSMETALREFGRQLNLQVVYPTEVVGTALMAPALSGRYDSASSALDKLLEGSGLSYRFVNAETVAIRVARPIADSARMEAARLARAAAPGSLQPVEAAKPGATADQTSSSSASAGLKVEEIVVTAAKRGLESVQDLPMSIAVITHQDIERRGLIGMEDYLRSIPGVNQIDQGAVSNAIVIRGITTQPQSENFYSGATVATYFDETPITAAAGIGQGGIDVRPVDIERIEVLRGPQGTAYGSGSLGGTLRIIPAKPKLDNFSAKLAASYSDTAREGGQGSMVQGVANIPLVANKFALRAVGYRYDESGFYRNIAGTDAATIAASDRFGLGDYVRGFVQDDIGHTLTTGGRLSALWQATDKLDLSVNLMTQKIEQDGWPAVDVGSYDQIRVPIAPQGRMRGEAGEIFDNEMNLLNTVVNYDFGWAALTSALSWIDADSAGSQATPASFIPFAGPSATIVHSDFKSFTAETRLVSKFAGRFQFLGGLFYEDVDNGYLNTLEWPGSLATNPFGTDPMAYNHLTRSLDQRAVFAELSYQLTEKVTATVGGRYFKYDKDQSQLLEGGLNGLPIGAGVEQRRKNGEDGSTFKASLSYKPVQSALMYASWAQGFRLGRPDAGVPLGACDTDRDGLIDGTSVSIESTRGLESDFLDNYEIGGKFTLFDRRMAVDAAVYHIDWDGLPVNVRAPGCIYGYFANAGAASSDGVEVQASVFVSQGLKVDFGAGYTSAELSTDVPGFAGSPRKGSRLPGSPKVSANLAAQYDFDVAGHKAFVRADSFYTGSFYGDFLQTPVMKAGDYIKVDARIGVAFGNLNTELFVRNLTDEDTFTWRGSSVSTPFFGYRLRPRTIGVQLGYTF